MGKVYQPPTEMPPRFSCTTDPDVSPVFPDPLSASVGRRDSPPGLAAPVSERRYLREASEQGRDGVRDRVRSIAAWEFDRNKPVDASRDVGQSETARTVPAHVVFVAMKFVASCSCKTFIGYALSEAEARKAGQDHLARIERSLAPIKLDGAHVLTVAPDRFWN
jgi:hypothetical protein